MGRLLTFSRPWTFAIAGEEFSVEHEGHAHTDTVLQLDRATVARGVFWSTVRIPVGHGEFMTLGGISNARAAELKEAATAAVARVRRRLHIADLQRQFVPELDCVVHWVADSAMACRERFRTRGWLSREFRDKIAATRPAGLGKLLAAPEIETMLRARSKEEQDAVTVWQQPLTAMADALNRQHLVKELEASKPFFDTVEKSPLTKEQAEAVICFEDRVLLVASAGSGKTSTMVAKLGYALKNGYFTADRMLLLAFNNDAAAELRERIMARLDPLGLPADRVAAMTFHAFGLDVIGKATGRRPSLASWVENGRDIETLLEMVDDLKSGRSARTTSSAPDPSGHPEP